MLSDSKRRRLYDDLGESGLKLVETPSQVNPVELIKNFQVIFPRMQFNLINGAITNNRVRHI